MLDLFRRQERSQLIFQKVKVINLAQKRSLAQIDVRRGSRNTRARKSSNFLVKSILEKCNMLAQQQQLNLIAHAQCFITLIKINDRRLIAMIDFDATNNFMIKAFVKREKYSIQKKLDAYNLVIVDRNSLFDENEKVNKETKLLLIAIQ